MQARPGVLVLGIALAVAVLLSACGGEDGGEAAEPALELAATTGIAADIARRVGGERVEVTQLVPEGANPHSYAPSAREQQELVEADLLVFFHPRLEEALPLDEVERSFGIARHVGELRALGGEEISIGEDDDHGHEDDDHGHKGEGGRQGQASRDDDHGHEEGSPDPHVWLDPTALGTALPALADELSELDPEGAEGYRQRAREYGAELDALDAEIAEMVERVPPRNRKLVTSHEMMGWYADRYGFEFVGAPFGTSPEAEASAAAVAELIAAVEAEGVPAVFAQQGDDPKLLRLIADEAGVEVVDELLVESFGEQAGSYLEMMRFTTEQITEALSGPASETP